MLIGRRVVRPEPLTNFAAVESELLCVAHCCAAAVLGADPLDSAGGAAQALVPVNLRGQDDTRTR
jgi:hypothetical protein